MYKVFAKEVDITNFPRASALDNIGSIVTIVVKNAFALAGVVALILIIVGGISMILGAGSGDAHKTEQGQKAVTGAVMGLVVIIVAVLIMQIIAQLTGLTDLGNFFK